MSSNKYHAFSFTEGQYKPGLTGSAFVVRNCIQGFLFKNEVGHKKNSLLYYYHYGFADRSTISIFSKNLERAVQNAVTAPEKQSRYCSCTTIAQVG